MAKKTQSKKSVLRPNKKSVLTPEKSVVTSPIYKKVDSDLTKIKDTRLKPATPEKEETVFECKNIRNLKEYSDFSYLIPILYTLFVVPNDFNEYLLHAGITYLPKNLQHIQNFFVDFEKYKKPIINKDIPSIKKLYSKEYKKL